MKKFTSTENCNALFAALSEFHRLLDRFNEGECDCPSLNQILKKNNIDKNYYKFIKEVLNERKLVNIQFTKWSDKKSLPNFQMAQSIAEEASKRLSAYQRDLKKKRNEKKEEKPQIMEDAPSESTELDPDILEIANAIRTLKRHNLTVTITF